MSTLTNLSRRKLLTGAAALTAASMAAPAIIRAAERDLRILTWEGYAEPEWLEKFKSDTAATVNIVYAGSADEMFAKMQGSNGGDFDLVSFDSSLFPRYIDAKLIQPVDRSRIPNLKNLAPEFQNVPVLMKGDDLYGLPFAWGSLPLIYDTAAFPTPPQSWEVMWDPQYSQQMLWQDDANNSVALGALITGAAKPYQLTDDDFARIKAKLIAQKALLLSYYAGFDDGVNLFHQNGVKLMYSMGEPQVGALIKKGIQAALTIPEERAVGWLDCWEVSAGVKDKDLAHAWINACLDPSVGKVLTEKLNYGNTTNPDVNAAVKMTYGGKLSWLEPSESYEKRVAVWNEIKAG